MEKPAKKRKATRSPATGRRNVFISFVKEDEPRVEVLREQARSEDGTLEFNDWSLRAPFDSERAGYIRRSIRKRIREASLTLVYVSARTAKSKWVNWEVEESVKLGKTVVGVYQRRKPSILPPAIKEHAIRVIAWSQKGIAKELK